MKTLALFLAMIVLAGCASAPRGPESDIRDPMYLRTEQFLPLTFAKIQVALFKHKAACGVAPELVVDADNSSYATIRQELPDAGRRDHPIVVQLILLQDMRVKAQAYSYYAGTEAEIQQIFDAIKTPGVCAS